jgi:multidrug efflux system membrane fusion protein
VKKSKKRSSALVVGAAGLLVVAALAAGCTKGAPAAAAERGAGGAGGERAVPVQVAKAAKRDVPIILEGLGTVTAYKTVNVRAQVDGRLDRVLFTEGQVVKRGQVLAQVDPRPFEVLLHQGQAALARDQAQLRGAELNLARYEQVVKEKLIPQQQADDQRALVDQYRAVTLGDKATIENARLQLDYARITSPIDGVTGVRQVDPGNLVHASDTTPIVVVTQLDPIAVLFTLPQDDLPRVAKARGDGGDKLTVEVRARDGGEPLATGKLGLVDNQINQATATIRLKAIFSNPDRALWPNQFVRARLRLDVMKGALVVPAVAVQRGPQGTFVYVVEGERAAAKPVTVELLQGDEAIVAKGLGEGDAVVIEGQAQLRPGAKVATRAGKP